MQIVSCRATVMSTNRFSRNATVECDALWEGAKIGQPGDLSYFDKHCFRGLEHTLKKYPPPISFQLTSLLQVILSLLFMDGLLIK